MRTLILLVTVFFPAAAVLLSLVLRKQFTNEKFRQIFVTAQLGITLLLVILALVLRAGARYELADQLVILYKTDGITILFSLVISIMWLLVGIYSFEYMPHEPNNEIYFRFYMLTESALLSIAFAGDYLTLYMSFELMTISSFPMVLNSRTKESVNAAMKYLFYSIFGTSLGLAGFFFLNTWAPTTEFVAGGTLGAAAVDHREGLLIVLFLVLIGFGTKAGMFPMHAWLPTAHPAAPAPASAVMSGIITKCGVIAIIRVVFYVAGPDFLRGTWVQYSWMTLALITVFMGSMLAYKENGFKKRLAYSSVSQVSYVLFGLSTLTPLGVAGAMMHLVFHAVIKSLLFLCSGAVIMKTGKKRVSELRGIGKDMPVVMWCFTIASLGLVGIPPMSGFVSKWYLAMGSLDSGAGALSILGPVILLISALLTAGYLFTISIRAFLPGADFPYETVVHREPGLFMLVPMILLAIAAAVLGIAAAPLRDALLALAETIV